MSNLDTVIDFGSQNLRLGVFDQSSKIIYSSNIKITELSESEKLDKSLEIFYYLMMLFQCYQKFLKFFLVNFF